MPDTVIFGNGGGGGAAIVAGILLVLVLVFVFLYFGGNIRRTDSTVQVEVPQVEVEVVPRTE